MSMISPLKKKNQFPKMYCHKNWNILPITTALLAIFTTLSHSAPIENNQLCRVENFQHAPGLYFEKQNEMFLSNANWNVIAFLGTRDMKKEFKNIRMNLDCEKHLRDDSL